MSKQIQAIRGMSDILPEATPYWQFIEKKLIECVTAYAYQEIRFPVGTGIGKQFYFLP